MSAAERHMKLFRLFHWRRYSSSALYIQLFLTSRASEWKQTLLQSSGQLWVQCLGQGHFEQWWLREGRESHSPPTCSHLVQRFKPLFCFFPDQTSRLGEVSWGCSRQTYCDESTQKEAAGSSHCYLLRGTLSPSRVVSNFSCSGSSSCFDDF